MLKKLVFLVVVFVFTMTVAAFAAVNINTADEAAFVALSGIGSAKAAAIVEYRKSHGNFESVEDLKLVKGIGAKTIEKLRDQITVE